MRGSNGGPKLALSRAEGTEKGRAIARINALKHGMTSNSPVIPEVEDEDAWQRHLDGFLESFAPEGFGRLLPSDDDLERIIRYETHIHRQFVQTLHELEALQARRRGERPHLARLDISSAPAG